MKKKFIYNKTFMGRFLLSIVLIFLVPFQSFAGIYFSSLLPNPAGKDEDGEYIEIRNTGCESVDISGYQFSDASGKSYLISSGISLSKWENRKFPYSETNIQLNNSWDESVFLKDSWGNMVDEVHYSGTQKDDVIIAFSLTDENCIPPENVSTGEVIWTGVIDSGSTFSGEILAGSGIENSGTGMLDIPSQQSGSGEISWIGGLADSGIILENPATNTEITWENTDNSGQTNSWNHTFTGKLSATSLSYGDADTNGFIETLFIAYPEILSGSVNTGSIALYSAMGGLYENRVNTETWYILSGSLSGNILILSILPSTIGKAKLKISNTTSSELRLKSSGDIGIRSMYGQELESFLLTSSFNDYRNIIHPEITISPVTDTVQSRWLSSEKSESGMVIFPDIVPTFQNYTNTTFSGNIFTCTTTPCRVNFTLEPIFTGSFSEKEYICSFHYGTGIYDTCNPPQLSLIGTGGIRVNLVHKVSGQILSITFPVEQKVVVNTIWNNTPSISNDKNPPVAILEFDGKIKSSMDLIGENEMNCYVFTCAINLTAEKSYDPEWGSVRFLWLYGFNDISTKKDPGERKYGLGDHRIELRVIDSAGNYASVFFQIHVLWPKPEIEKQKEEKPKKEKTKKTKETLSASGSITRKTIKKIKMQFFSPPEIILQGKTLTGWENTFECLAAKTTCQINLTLTGATRSDRYEWILSNGEVFQWKNPKWWNLPIGSHSVELHIYKKWETTPYWSQIYGLEVKKKTSGKKKTSKKIKAPKAQKTKEIPSLIPETFASDGAKSQSTSSFWFLFIFGFWFLYIFRRRFYRASEKDIG